MSPSSWRSEADPFAHLIAHGPIAEATSAAAWLQAQLDFEAALAAAQAAAGEIPADAAEEIAARCHTDYIDVDALAVATAQGGVSVIGVVEQLRAAVGAEAAGYVHRGATSQDVLDSAAMIVVGRAATLTADQLGAAAAAVERLAGAHGATPIIGRTLGQYALPTTFATVTDRWRSGLAEAQRTLRALNGSLPVQLGGPVGDATSYGPNVAAITTAVAGRLGLAVPDHPWSSMRTPVARIAGACGVAGTVVGDVAAQLVALMGSDVGELAERADGAGGSSSMGHKRNPVAAISACAAAMQVPGLVATLLRAAAGHEFERAAGAWHAEWPALNALLRAAGSSAGWLVTSLERVVVDPDRMAANLEIAERERNR